jgi:hypothetical protein
MERLTGGRHGVRSEQFTEDSNITLQSHHFKQRYIDRNLWTTAATYRLPR